MGIKNVKYLLNLKDFKKNLSAINKDILIQEYIEGSGLGFFAIYDHGKMRNFFMHKRLREFPSTGGASVLAKSIYDYKAFRYGKLLLDELKWHGVAMVEFKKNKIDNKLYLMEINPKFWGSHDLAISCGVNFANEYISISPLKKTKIRKIRGDVHYPLNKKFQWPTSDIFSNILKPISLLKVIIDFLDMRVDNNLFINDPLASLYMLLYSFLRPIFNFNPFNEILKFAYRFKNNGFKIAFVRSFTEITGIPILRFSIIYNNIALGMQPKYFGYIFLKKNKYKYILNLRYQHNYLRGKGFFIVLNIPVREKNIPTIKQLNLGADYINKVVRKDCKIYIHCREGVSRGPLFVVAYFIKYEGYSLKKALIKISSKRNFINVLPNQILILKKFEKIQKTSKKN